MATAVSIARGSGLVTTWAKFPRLAPTAFARATPAPRDPSRDRGTAPFSSGNVAGSLSNARLQRGYHALVAGKRRQNADGALRALFDRIAAGASAEVLRTLKASPELARQSLDEGATRADWSSYFLSQITHGVYAGDTALHVAAAAYQYKVARALLDIAPA